MSITIQPYTKQFLSQILGISSQTLARYLNKNEIKLLNVYPQYSKTDKRLHPLVFKFVCDENGVSSNQIAEILKVNYPGHNQIDVEGIKRLYGLFDQ